MVGLETNINGRNSEDPTKAFWIYFVNLDSACLPENLFRIHHQRKKRLKKTEFWYLAKTDSYEKQFFRSSAKVNCS